MQGDFALFTSSQRRVARLNEAELKKLRERVSPPIVLTKNDRPFEKEKLERFFLTKETLARVAIFFCSE